jgi:transposase
LSSDAGLEDDLKMMLEGSTKGDPERLLYWTLLSTRNIADALVKQGHKISHVQVYRMLKILGYSLQAKSKNIEGSQHTDRDAQFKFIEKTCKKALKEDQPVISVDTKKKRTGWKL